jgi:pimeloyl-ACP methyl ester carboxylesterase
MVIRHGDAVRAVILVATTPGQLGVGETPAPEGPPMPDEFAELLQEMPASDEELALGMVRLAPAYLQLSMDRGTRLLLRHTHELATNPRHRMTDNASLRRRWYCSVSLFRVSKSAVRNRMICTNSGIVVSFSV